MKPVKEKLISNLSHSFRVKHSVLNALDSPWHYHEEYELFYIIKSRGQRFVGDSINNFTEGDLVFMGQNLPHVWKNDIKQYQNKKKNNAEAIVIQFRYDSLGKEFFNLPEMRQIKEFLILSKRGMVITGSTRQELIPLMSKIVKEAGVERIITLLAILAILSKSKDIKPLASKSFEKIFFDETGKRVDKVFSYVANNYDKNIELKKAAEIAGMSQTAFCRYFKRRTIKTFFQYVIETRLSYAANLLLNNDKTINEICFECGFKNVSYFIRQFKKYYGTTPIVYRKNLTRIK